ncbi:MAG: fibronectin type III domain-containing protein, partial [Verrucomicrobiota bacterium]
WSGRPNHPITQAERSDGWDIYARLFKADGTAAQPEFRVNSFTYGDQFRPRLSYQDGINLVLWTSMKQDGSWEGVVARLVWRTGDFLSKEFRMNTTTAGKQIYPTVAADGNHTFLGVWSSYVPGGTAFDLLAQRYGSMAESSLGAPGAPYVSALSQTRLSVTWPELAGYEGVRYEVYVDGNSEPVTVQNNSAIIVALQPDSTHSVKLAYLLQDGTRSPLSAAASGKTWAEDSNYDGLPDDWQSQFWKGDASLWPNAGADSDGDGASNLQELLAGTDPTDAASVLRLGIRPTEQGPLLEWNTEPGCIYQVQVQAPDHSWTSVGPPRFAAGKQDSIPVDGGGAVALYRVIRVR